MDRINVVEVQMVLGSGDTSWFLAQLKPNSSKIAERNLNQQGFKTFLPMEEQTRQRNGKFVTTLRPLFPGYIFVAFDVTRGLWQAVNSTSGITKLVRFGEKPAAVPLDLVSQLVLRCDDQGKLLPLQSLTPGDQVTLTKGPFANLLAEVEKISPNQRAWVLLDVMGSHTKVSVRLDHLRSA